MSQIRVSFIIEIPDGARVSTPDVEYAEPEYLAAASAAFPDAYDPDARVAPVSIVSAPADTLCPVHHVAFKTVPAGTSKRTGKPYEAFLACPATGCNEKPRRAA